MSRRSRPILLRYGVAVLAAALAVLVRLLLDPFLGDRFPLITGVAAVGFTAWYGGRGPALLAMGTGAAGATFFVMEPRYSFAVSDVHYRVGLGLYALVGLILISIFDSLRQARWQAQDRQRQLEREMAVRLRREEELAAHERQYHTLADSIPQLCWMANPDGYIFWYNRRWYDYTGMTQDQAEGWGWQRVRHPEELPKVLERWKGAVGSGEPWEDTFQLRRYDGAFRPHLSRAIPVKDDRGRVVRWFGTDTDITAIKEAEEVLREQEERLRLAAEATGVGIFDYDPLSGRQMFSEQAMRVWGFLPGTSLTPETVLNAVHPDDREWVRAAVKASLDPEGTGRFEVKHRIIRPDGEIRWVATSGQATPVNGADRERVRMIGTMLDVTEAERAGRQLRASEARFRLLADSMPQVVWVADSDGTVRYYNSRVAGFFGARQESDGTWVWRPEVHPEDVASADSAWRAAAEDRTPFQCEHRLRMADGAYRWHLSRAVPVSAGPHGETRWFGTATDVHDLKTAEEALRQSQRRELERRVVLETVLRATPTPIWISRNRECTEITGNPAAYRLLKTPEHGVISATAPGDLSQTRIFREYRDGEPIAPGELPLQVAARDGVEVHGAELTLVFTDGDVRHIYGNAVPLRDESGQVVGSIAAFVDITRLKQVEEALKDADRKKDEFLATLAHELRNPLAPVRNAVQLLRMLGPKEARIDQVRDMIERQVTHMVRLVDDLFEVSRITRGKIELQKERVSLSRVVQNAVEISGPLMEAGRHELTLALPTRPAEVEGDVLRLTQVVTNLLNNAAKFTPEGGHIWLTVERQAGEGIVRVRDNGAGIPADMLLRVFDLFTQVHSGAKRSHGGLGIGLALVKRLVEMHGGRVEARSDGPGRGAEFVVRLPLANSGAENTEDGGQDGYPGGSRPCRILVVDDNVDAAESLAMMLSHVGHEVRTAHDGPTGVEQAAVFEPDVIFLDLGMPGMDGYETARMVRDLHGNHKKLVALTGWGQEDDRRRTREAGFDAHLVKPVSLADLQEVLASVGAE